MTTAEKKVATICKQIYDHSPQQIIIDFVQEEVEELLNKLDVNSRKVPVTRDEPGALAYQCSIMLDAYNPAFEWDILILKALREALGEWSIDIENTNNILGLPKET